MVARFGRERGKPMSVSVVPGLVVQAMGLFVPPVKEMLEMRYQWQGCARR